MHESRYPFTCSKTKVLGFIFWRKKFFFFRRIFSYGYVRQKLIFAVFGPGSQVDRQRSRLLGPLWADLTEILRGKRARVWLRMMQILLGHVEVRGRISWKTIKNRRFSLFLGQVGFWRFLPVFQPLLLRTSKYPNKISIISSHTLARLPRKISAGSAHRGPSNRLRSPSTRVKKQRKSVFDGHTHRKNSREKCWNFFSKNQIRHNARSPRERTACCVDICPTKGVSHFIH